MERLPPRPQKGELSWFQLNRYLDYCSEMLSLAGKIAALYAQKFNDSNVVAAVNEIELLTTALIRKIWQKLMLLEQDSVKKNVEYCFRRGLFANVIVPGRTA